MFELFLCRCFRFYFVFFLSMLNLKMVFYECEKLVKYCKWWGVLDEVMVMKLEKVFIVVFLKVFVVVLEVLESIMRKFFVDDGFLGSK